MSGGNLRVNVVSMTDNRPVKGAKITIYNSEGEEYETGALIITDDNGKSEPVELMAPDRELSEQPEAVMPYAVYNILVDARGYESVYIAGIQILAGEVAQSDVLMMPVAVNDDNAQSFVIGPHTLYGDYPPKQKESEIKDVTDNGQIVLSRVVIPEYVVVHDGPPSDSSAKDYYVKYTDYIKNVASSEIYATWEEAAILANVLAIMSFTLNRVYTEWYRGKGYDFTITSSTAFDHKWIYNRNIYDSVSQAVDNVFNNYISRPGITQPLLTQYCDGKRVTCKGWMSQWGSNDLARQGYSAIEILRYYYGDDVFINSTSAISGVPSSWPGYNLTVGSRGQKVAQLQRQINEISNAYPQIPKLAVDGIYGEKTSNSVSIFQRIFNLPVTGVADFATWYKISQIYVGVSRIAELMM